MFLFQNYPRLGFLPAKLSPYLLVETPISLFVPRPRYDPAFRYMRYTLYIGVYLLTWNRCIGTNELPVHRYLSNDLSLPYRTAPFSLLLAPTLWFLVWSSLPVSIDDDHLDRTLSLSLYFSQPRLGQSNRCVENFSRVRLIGRVSTNC